MSDQFCSAYNRYTSTSLAVSSRTLSHTDHYHKWLLLSAGIGDSLLLLRVVAIFRTTRILTITMRTLYGIVYILEFSILVYYLNSASVSGTHGYEGNLGCVMTEYYSHTTIGPNIKDALLSIATGPVVVLNIIFLATVLINLLPVYRKASNGTKTPLITALLRDGALYFAAMAGSTVFTTLTPLLLNPYPSMENMSLPWFFGVGPMASARLFRNLRVTAAQVKAEEDERNRALGSETGPTMHSRQNAEAALSGEQVGTQSIRVHDGPCSAGSDPLLFG